MREIPVYLSYRYTVRGIPVYRRRRPRYRYRRTSEGQHLGADEAALEVRVDGPRRLRRQEAPANDPSLHLRPLATGNCHLQKIKDAVFLLMSSKFAAVGVLVILQIIIQVFPDIFFRMRV